ncbi:MAG: preprotein translocase subunit SecG [Opitutales bacterium]
MSIVLGILTFVLILVAVFLIMVVLAQKAQSDGGVGGALGGGMTEAAFGADSSNVLSKMTINLAIAFFVLSFVLYLGRIYQRNHVTASQGALPTISVPVTRATGATAGAPAVSVPTPATGKAAPVDSTAKK